MKNPLNKAYEPQNKTSGTEVKKDMNPELQKIMDIAAGIGNDISEKKQEYIQGIEKAQAAQEKAEEDKNTATTEKQFNQACDEAAHAKEKEQFFRRLLNDLQYAPRMDEAAYDDAVNTVDSVVLDAAESFREIAKEAMKSIVQARKEYLDTLRDADTILIKLDKAANVLQSRYRYRVNKYVGREDEYVEDPSEWKWHTTRYQDTGKGYLYACKDKEKPFNHVTGFSIDEYLGEAWRAAGRIK